MNPIAARKRRPVTTLMLVVALAGGGVFGPVQDARGHPGAEHAQDLRVSG